jgi:hypothetical protein
VKIAVALQLFMQWILVQAVGVGVIVTVTYQQDFKLQIIMQRQQMNKEYFEALVESGYTLETAQKIAEGMDLFINNITKEVKK